VYLYLYQSNLKNEVKASGSTDQTWNRSELLVRKALKDYSKRRNSIPAMDHDKILIKREEKGKPYFVISKDRFDEKLPVHFSVSHSGRWWGCLMAEETVGFDLEVCRQKVNYEKIADRFFSQEESQYVRSAGLDAFFEIWVRKEAFVKYLGTGIGEGLDSFSVLENGSFADLIHSKEKAERSKISGIIRSCEIEEDLKGAYCSQSGNLIEKIIKFDDWERIIT